jgi:hypothetical protein
MKLQRVVFVLIGMMFLFAYYDFIRAFRDGAEALPPVILAINPNSVLKARPITFGSDWELNRVFG